MKPALLAIILLSFLNMGAAAQTTSAPRTAATQPPLPLNLSAILADLQRASVAANGDIGKLRIEKWKADGSQKQQMQQVADSLQKNISGAVPGLISDVQAAPGSVAKAFKLYHNLNVVYEFLNSLAEAAGAYGKKEEYEPLSGDAAALDDARQKLSAYIEQVAANLESSPKSASGSQSAASGTGPKKIIVDDGNPAPKSKKPRKKTASAPPPPSKNL